jgi:Anti-sigma-K factor rskA/Putative zinc-finger
VKTRSDELHVLTGSYALNALPGPDRDVFERHLRHCASCTDEVRGLRETAARLAMAKALQPPARMEQRVLAATYQTRQLPPAADGQLAERRQARDQRRMWLPRLAALAAAAALVLVVVLGVAQILTQRQLQTQRASSAAISQVITAPDARIESMRTTVGGNVTVVVSALQRAAVITASGLPALAQGQVYQVWVMTPSGARSAGLLSRTGQAAPLLASAVAPADRIGITVEPDGGTSKPTTTPLAVVPLSA